MGQRGPRPKPPALRLLQAGATGQRAGGGSGRAKMKAGRPARPDDLPAEAVAEWDRIVPELDAAGWLSVVDRAALVAYCLAWADLVAVTAVLDTEGRVIRQPMQSARGDVIGERVIVHPAVRLQKNAFDRVRVLIEAFGLSPRARRAFEPGPDAGSGPPPGNRVADIAQRVQAARGNRPG